MRLLLPLYRFWTASKVQYQPLDGGHGLRRRLYDYRLLFALLVSAGLGAFICYLVVAYLCGPLTLTPYRNPLGVYENINPFPASSARTGVRESTAVVTSLYSDDFALAVATLGQSLHSSNVTARKVVIYLPDRVSSHALCIVKAAGWEPHAVPYIYPPHNGAGVFQRFRDQYTKLNVWGFETLGITSLIYLDGDTLVRGNFDELWNLPFTFAAVMDMYGDNRGFVVGFNAGVLFLRPSSEVLKDMKSKLETAHFNLEQAEQAFLNVYFAPKTTRLPYIYNGNLAIKQINPSIWESIKNEMKVVHYTVLKPFWYGAAIKSTWGSTLDSVRQSVVAARPAHGGQFFEEIGWWSEAWEHLVERTDLHLQSCWE